MLEASLWLISPWLILCLTRKKRKFFCISHRFFFLHLMGQRSAIAIRPAAHYLVEFGSRGSLAIGTDGGRTSNKGINNEKYDITK